MTVSNLKDNNFRNWLTRQLSLAKNQRTIVASVMVTPDDAAILLENNDGNRSINNTHVSVLADAMTSGEWMETGDTIKLDKSGRILDGQHRLMAVRTANTPVRFDFAFGVATEAFDRIDVGRARTAGNIFEIAGFNNGATLATTSKILMSIEAGYKAMRSMRATRHQLLEYMKANPDMIESGKIGKEISRGIGKAGSVSGISAGVFLIRQRMGDHEPAEFFGKVATGVGLHTDSPILAFRNRCIRSADGRPLDGVDVAALLVKAFNFWHEGRACKILTWRSLDEDFPKVGQ